MLRKVFLPLFVLPLCAVVSAKILNGSVTMPAASSGYIVNKDSMVAPLPEESAPADVVLKNIGCTLSCPGSCMYRISGCKKLYQFLVPIDSVNFSVPIDTADTALVRRVDQGLQIDAHSMYGKENKPDIAFIIKTCTDKFAVFRVVKSETKPVPALPLPDDCYGYEIINLTMNWVYQDDGSLFFDKPMANERITFSNRHEIRYLSRTTRLSLFPFTPGRVPAAAYDILGRFRNNSPLKASPGLLITEVKL